MNKEVVHIFFSGTVQGVGFRFTVRSLALKYNIAGWVTNLSDGRAELLAQAQSRRLIAFLQDLRREFKGYIMDENIQWLKAKKEWDNFIIKF